MNNDSWNPYDIPAPEKYLETIRIPYRKGEEEDPFAQLYLTCPKNAGDSPTPLVIYFHGGGFTIGPRNCLPYLYNGISAVAEVRYPLAPCVMPPKQIEYAASAIAYLFIHGEEYNIDPAKIFIVGYSAGAYLAAITMMNPRFMEKYPAFCRNAAGLILISGQMSTHFYFKEAMGDKRSRYMPLFDEYAPISHLSPDLPPILLVTGASGLDMAVRPEENQFMAAALKAMGHPFIECFPLAGTNHAGVMTGAERPVLDFMARILSDRK